MFRPMAQPRETDFGFRRVGEDVADGSDQAALARAEAMLARRDLAGAAAALDGLKGKPAEILADWRAGAAARAAAAKALERLSRHAIDRLAASAGGPDGGSGGGRP